MSPSLYPTSLDNLSTTKTNSTLLLNDHPQHHDDLADAVNHIQSTLGLSPQGGFATVRARLDSIGGGSGAPAGATYITLVPDGTLSNETLLSAVIGIGSAASRPTTDPNQVGRLYYITDSGSQRWTRDSGTGWVDTAVHWNMIVGLPSTFTPSAHKSSHVTGGGDAFVPGDLLDATAKTVIRKNSGADVAARRRINFVEGAGVTITLTDSNPNEEVAVQIDSTSAASTASFVTMNTEAGLSGEFVLGTQVLMAGAGAPPAAATNGRFYFNTSTGTLFRDNGTSFVQVAAATVHGSTNHDGTVASLVSGKVPVAQLASGTPTGALFYRDDQTLARPGALVEFTEPSVSSNIATTDMGKIVRATTGGITLTLPNGIGQKGSNFVIGNEASTAITIAAGASVQVFNQGASAPFTINQYIYVTLIKTVHSGGGDVWHMVGI